MNTHTKGPWTVETRSIVAIEAADHCGPIAEIRARLDLPACDRAVEETRQANAALIAAAPDLLEALLRLVGDVDLAEVDLESPDRDNLEFARQAIAKAKGEA